jgi:hypothetical protein
MAWEAVVRMTNDPARSVNAVLLPRVIAPKAVLRSAEFRI